MSPAIEMLSFIGVLTIPCFMHFILYKGPHCLAGSTSVCLLQTLQIVIY